MWCKETRKDHFSSERAALIFASINKVRSYASRTSDLGRIRKLSLACGAYSIDCGHYPDSFQVAGMTWNLQLFPALGLEAGNAVRGDRK